MKSFSLKFIQIAWVAQAAAILVFTMAVLIFMPPERVGLWLQFIPAFAGLTAAQGAAAAAGPLAADKIKQGAAGQTRQADKDSKGEP